MTEKEIAFNLRIFPLVKNKFVNFTCSICILIGYWKTINNYLKYEFFPLTKSNLNNKPYTVTPNNNQYLFFFEGKNYEQPFIW